MVPLEDADLVSAELRCTTAILQAEVKVAHSGLGLVRLISVTWLSSTYLYRVASEPASGIIDKLDYHSSRPTYMSLGILDY